MSLLHGYFKETNPAVSMNVSCGYSHTLLANGTDARGRLLEIGHSCVYDTRGYNELYWVLWSSTAPCSSKYTSLANVCKWDTKRVKYITTCLLKGKIDDSK